MYAIRSYYEVGLQRLPGLGLGRIDVFHGVIGSCELGENVGARWRNHYRVAPAPGCSSVAGKFGHCQRGLGIFEVLRRITSYNVCYTKLLREQDQQQADGDRQYRTAYEGIV